MAGVPTPTERHITATDLPALPGKLELTCKACGKWGRYEVGRVCLDPDAMGRATGEQHWVEEAVCFSGYFRCRACNAAGPWGLRPMTYMRLAALAMLAHQNQGQPLVTIARPQLFDGTLVRTAAQGEAHLQQLLGARPNDFFLWSRLGNLYTSAEMPEQAFAAFTRAVELNPHDVESLHSLACYWLNKKENERAAEYFTQVLRYCRTEPPRDPALWHNMVRHTLEKLFDLHQASHGRIPFLPPLDVDRGVNLGPQPVVVLRQLDLSREESWEQLTRMYLTGKTGERGLGRTAFPRPGLRLPASGAGGSGQVGRNDRCPCGSGRKFKHCCGRR
jgi:hypothetical protein